MASARVALEARSRLDKYWNSLVLSAHLSLKVVRAFVNTSTPILSTFLRTINSPFPVHNLAFVSVMMMAAVIDDFMMIVFDCLSCCCYTMSYYTNVLPSPRPASKSPVL